MPGRARPPLLVALAGPAVVLLFAVAASLAPTPTATVVVGLAGYVVAMAVYATWYAVVGHELRKVAGDGWPLTLWTILLFIPVAQFVSLYKMAELVRRAQAARGVAGLNPVAMFLWLMFPVVTFPPLNLVGVYLAQYQANKVWRMPDSAPAVRGIAAPEVLPMPGPAVVAVAFAWSSLAFAFAGPAGIAAALVGLYYRARFRALEAAAPGHRGARLVAAVPWVAAVGILVGVAMSGLYVWAAFTSDTTVSAK